MPGARRKTLEAGVAVIDVTPPVGIDLSGFCFGASKGVLHPLGAHALFLDDGKTRLLVISADLIGFDTDLADVIRVRIAEACGMGVDGVMLAGTHTHSGPATICFRNWGEPDHAYRAELADKLVQVAREASQSVFDARIGSGWAFVPGVGVNRTRKGGPTDPEVDLLRVDDTDGNVRAAVLTCGCHPVGLHSYKNLITPDFPWYTRQWLKGKMGEEVVVVHLSSPFADQNPENFEFGGPTEDAACATGEKLAEGLYDAFMGIETSADRALACAGAQVELPLAALPGEAEIEEALACAREKLAEVEGKDGVTRGELSGPKTEVEWTEDALKLKRTGAERSAMNVTLQAFDLGDAAILAIPAEVFVEIGFTIRKGSPFYRTLMATQANGTVGYIPSADAFTRGCYEATYAPKVYGTQLFTPDVGVKTAEAGAALLQKLRCEEVDAPASRTVKSRQLRKAALKVVVGGCQSHKAPGNPMFGAPAFVERAQGSRFWDVDGNEYIDYLLSYGPIVLGHNHPAVSEAVKKQLAKGTIFDVEFPEMVELSEKLVGLIPCAEMTAYFVGGSGATSGAVSMARSHTKRDKIIRSGYHGWHPWTQSGTPNCPKCYGDLTLSVDYGDLDALEKLLRDNAGEVAGMIIESVQAEGPPEGYFDGVRRLADEHGVVFILDEVKTGFRFDLGGAQKRFGIDPDLACFGKAMCNGYPGSVVVGKRSVMESRTDTWLAATFHADAISIAAALATIAELERCDGIAHQWRIGGRLKDGLTEIFKEAGVGLRVRGFPCMGALSFYDPSHARLCERYSQFLIADGVYLTGHPWFISLSHTDADVDETLEKAARAMKRAIA